MYVFKTKSMKDIENIGGGLLARRPSAALRYRILRDVFRLPAHDGLLQAAKVELLKSGAAKSLALPPADRSMEEAVDRALTLGLDKSDAFLAGAAACLVNILEKGTDLAATNAAASLLCRIDPWNGALDRLWNQWLSVAQAAFSSGSYSAEEEAWAIRNSFGADACTGLPCLESKAVLGILATRSRLLPKGLEELLMHHVWKSPSCMGVAGLSLSGDTDAVDWEAWLGALELLSGFGLGLIFAEPQVFLLWHAQGPDGLWGQWHSPQWMLSDSWRDDERRRMDMTARVLIYLRKNWGC